MAESTPYGRFFDHYSFLWTLEDEFGLGHIAGATNAESISKIWKG